MNQLKQTVALVRSISLCCLFLIGSLSLLPAQIWETTVDSTELQRLENRKSLQADPDVQNKVDEEINEYRLLMLSYEWWNLPTDREEKRMSKAKESRYQPYDSPLENTAWRNTNGVLYRNQGKVRPKQDLIVLGWHPYWEKEAYKTYNFQLLTHVAYYGYEVNPFTGGYKNFRAIHDFESSDLIQTAHLDTCKVLLTVSNRGYDSHEIFFTSEPQVQKNLIDSLRLILLRTGADGLDLNFEEVPIEYKKDFLDFIRELSFAVREDNNNYTISLSLPLYDKDNIYDLNRLKPWVDFFVVNGFNFHLDPTQLKEGPLSPLLTKDAPIRSSMFLYEQYTNLASLLASEFTVSNVTILHNERHINRLKDSLNMFIRSYYRNLEYDDFDITDILNTIRKTKNSRDVPLWLTPNINAVLRRTRCKATLSQTKSAAKDADKTRFFLFEPTRDTLRVKEYPLFLHIGEVQSEVDSQLFDLNSVVEHYKSRIGGDQKSSLVLGLPYHGAVWYQDRERNRDFEGYIPYSEILKLIEQGQASVDYDKATHSLIATLRDSLGGVYRVYFDNSTSLGRKYNFAVNQGLGGVGLWALGADYSHTELWATLEESFVNRRVWNEEKGVYERVTVDKGNKVNFTIQYLLKRFSPLTFATLFFITIFICISFCFSVLDWKVRDVLFYTGAFRIFYLVLFTIIVLVLGNWLGLFENKVLTFVIGTALGLLLMWAASNLVSKNHRKLP